MCVCVCVFLPSSSDMQNASFFAPYYTDIRLYLISPHYLTNGTTFGKYLLNIGCKF